MANREHELVLKYPQLDLRVNKLFDDMRRSRALRESFVRDPAGVTLASIFNDAPGRFRSKLSSANRLLYCFLADAGMREWANEYALRMLQQFDGLRKITDPAERKREFMLRVDRNQVAQDFSEALGRVGGPELTSAIADNDGIIGPPEPLGAVIGPFIAAAPVLVVAYIGLFVAIETEFAVHQHNALWGPETMPAFESEHDSSVREESASADEVVNWLGLTRTNLKRVADTLAAAMTASARQLQQSGILSQPADEVQAALERLSLEGRL